MSFLNDKFSELKKASEPIYASPKSVQQTIDISKISESGIFENGAGKFSRTYRFEDANFTTRSEEEKEPFLKLYCKCLNTMEQPFMITVNNKNKDKEKFEKESLMEEKNDGLNEIRNDYNKVVSEKMYEGRQGIEQDRYLTVMVERKSFEEAKIQFANIEASMYKPFAQLGSRIIPLTGNERLKVIHDYNRLGREDEFNFDIAKGRVTGADFINAICNTSIKFNADFIEDECKFCRVLYIKNYPTFLDTDLLNKLISLPIHSVTTISAVPIPKEITTKILDKKYLGVESDIIKQQQARNRNNDFASDISYKVKREKAALESIMTSVRENDERLFHVSVTMAVMAGSKKELDSICNNIKSIATGEGCTVDTLLYKQREALNSTIPIGVRQVEVMRTLLTQSLGALMPFNVQEVMFKDGLYYGINQVSKNLIKLNRKMLQNGNGFVFGGSGSGKSFTTKMEMGQVILTTKDYVRTIDPMLEYRDVTLSYGGEYINISNKTSNFINPMDMDVWQLDIMDSKGWVSDKCEFVLSLMGQIMKELTPQEKSIISRCVKNLYMEIASSKEKYIPLLEDLYEKILECEEPEARDIALAMEIFVTGALNVFNHQTNIDTSSRFITYGIRDLGESLEPLAMLIVMESIQQTIIRNGERGIATWLYVDEIHMLMSSELSSEYLRQMWKKVRKQGGLCTGITQNISDLMINEKTTTMISNSSFILLLKQSNKDIENIRMNLELSTQMLEYITDSPAGTGLIRIENKTVPFDNTVDKNNGLYKLYNTNMYELMKKS